MQTILRRFNWSLGSVACRRRRQATTYNHVIKLASCYMTTTTTSPLSSVAGSTSEGKGIVSGRGRDTGRGKDKRRTSSDIVLGRHVREALANGQPVVALESTVITHGLPEPRNLELALELEREVNDNHGAPGECMAVTPATVGIIKGQLIVGLSGDEIEYLAQSSLSRPIKASRRDLALAQAYGLSAGTTVSATMALASSCCATSGVGNGRIHVFATGGMGGVHLGGEQSMDVSADLMEMSRSPMGVVASGFKSFLDTRRSLEYLETMGCTVASLRELHQTAEVVDYADRKSQLFPGFFSEFNRERVGSPWQCRSIQEAARILYYCTNNKLRNQRAMLLACPIPKEFSLDNQEYAHLMDQVVSEVEGRAGSGQEKTPLILAELARRTQGRTLGANLALLRNNARIGAHLAHEHALLLESLGAPSLRGSQGQRCVQPEGTNQRCVIVESGGGGSDKRDITSVAAVETDSRKPPAPEVDNSNDDDATTTTTTAAARRRPIVIGCTMIDMHVRTKIDAQFKANPHYSGVTFAGHPHLTLGGVGRNLAAGLQLLGHSPLFVTSLARDALGEFALNEMQKIGFRHDQSLKVLHAPQSMSSPFALVLMDSLTGQCEYVIANLEAARVIVWENLVHLEGQITGKTPPTLVVTDANLPAHTLEHIIDLCATHAVPLFLEPTDVACLARLVGALKLSQLRNHHHHHHHQIALMSPNVVELEQMLRLFEADKEEANEQRTRAQVTTIPEVQILAAELMQRHLPGLRCLLVTMDKRGVLVGVRLDSTDGASGAQLDHLNIMKLATTEIKDSKKTTTWTFKHYPPHQLIERPISGSGAGDCFASGFISGLLLELPLGDCVSRGFQAARCALLDRCTVPETLRKLAMQV